jgi:hypothetical protein
MSDRTSVGGHSREALRLWRVQRLRYTAAGADWKRGADDALLVSVGELGDLCTTIKASLWAQTFF